MSVFNLPASANSAISVVEMISVSSEAAQLGLKCRAKIASTLAAHVDARVVLERIRDALQATADDPATRTLRAAVLEGKRPTRDRNWAQWWVETRRFVARALAGIGGISETGDMMALHVDTDGGSILVLATIGGAFRLGPSGSVHQRRAPGEPALLVLSTAEGVDAGTDQLVTAFAR